MVLTFLSFLKVDGVLEIWWRITSIGVAERERKRERE